MCGIIQDKSKGRSVHGELERLKPFNLTSHHPGDECPTKKMIRQDSFPGEPKVGLYSIAGGYLVTYGVIFVEGTLPFNSAMAAFTELSTPKKKGNSPTR